jgi:hypothetical protein
MELFVSFKFFSQYKSDYKEHPIDEHQLKQINYQILIFSLKDYVKYLQKYFCTPTHGCGCFRHRVFIPRDLCPP